MRGANQQELIFRKSTFIALGGFVHFPLAWWSDVAFVIGCGARNGYWTMQDAKIFFRLSGENISCKKDRKIDYLKYDALVRFMVWLTNHIEENECTYFPKNRELKKMIKQHFYDTLRRRRSWISHKEIMRVAELMKSNFGSKRKDTYIKLLYFNLMFLLDKKRLFIRRFLVVG